MLIALVGILFAMPAVQEAELAIDRDDITITSSTRIKKGEYRVADVNGNGVLRITADNVVVDFQGATLWSGDPAAPPDGRAGVGVRIEGAKNVTIRNANVHGFAFCIEAIGCENLLVERCDASHSKAQRLLCRAGENKVGEDFLNLRDVRAWREYGAGFWVERCTGARVTDCRAADGQNGVLLVRADRGHVTGGDFSFNSGWGIGLHGASDNVVAFNRCDFCLRGSWWPDFKEGSDSAAMAVVGGSHRNWILANSMTHGGDGFFLSNGVDIRDPKEGSCNDNVVAFNDGSWAAANAFESTFSDRNVFVGNMACESRFGWWNGFSSFNVLAGNTIEDNEADGIAIEHGRGNVIEMNRILRSGGAGIHLWSLEGDATRAANPSKDPVVRANRIVGSARAGLMLTGTSGARVEGNAFVDNLAGLEFNERIAGATVSGNSFEIGPPPQGNLALGKRARFSVGGKEAEEAAVRSTNGILTGEKGFEPHWGKGDYYELDLGRVEKFNRLLINPRNGDPYCFLFDFSVLVSTTDAFRPETTREAIRHRSRASLLTWEIAFPEVEGRFIRIVAMEPQDWTGVVECQVFRVTDEKGFRESRNRGQWHVQVKPGVRAAATFDGNFWADSGGRPALQLIRSEQPFDLKAAPAGRAFALAAPAKLLTYADGLAALMAGRSDDIKRELAPLLKAVGCAINVDVTLPGSKSFRMYRDAGVPCGKELLRSGEWGPLKPATR